MKYGATLIFYFTLMLFLHFDLSSQGFSISEINTDEFPTVKASFIATNQAGNSYEDLADTNFTVMEDNLNVDASVTVKCIKRDEDPEVSVVLVLDQSLSMKEPEEDPRWNWVVQGATSFINTLKFVGRTKLAITSFARGSYIVCNFSSDKDQLLSALDTVVPVGITRYDPPFLDPRYGVVQLLSSRPTDIRRIVVFLTDGLPDKDPSTARIIDSLQNANIQVYSITLQMPMNKDLAYISRETGGRAFSVNDKEELDNIYKYIALDVQTKTLCELTWESYYGCDEKSRIRNVEIRFKKDLARELIERRYLAPESSIAYVDRSSSILSFGNPDVGVPVKDTVTITSAVTGFQVDSIYISPPNYYSVTDVNVGQTDKTVPFFLDSGKSRSIEVTFTQAVSKIYRQASLILVGNPCPPQITLVGGTSQVRIINPAGGELFSTCDTIDIIWAGVDWNVPVDFSYSTDDGTTWAAIANNAYGLQLRWKPPEVGVNYRIRAIVEATRGYMWATANGGNEDDIGASIAVQNDDLFVYATGSFEETAHFGDIEIQSVRNKDIFIAKYNSDGNPIWVQQAGGLNNDFATGVCTDSSNFAYITGTCYQTVKFGNLTPTVEQDDLRYCFIAKYDPSQGPNPKVTLLGAKGFYTRFEAWGQRIKYVHDDTNPKIMVQGMYLSSIQIQIPGGPQRNLPNATSPRLFTAVYDLDLNIVDIYEGGINENYSSNTDTDSKGSIYSTGSFQNQRDFGGFTVTSAGKRDIFVTKIGSTPGSEFTTESFAVTAPSTKFNLPDFDLGECTLGSVCGKVFSQSLENDGELPVEISDVSFSGPDALDFGITSNIIGVIIPPGNAIDIELFIKPSDVFSRNAVMTVDFICGDSLSADITGMGICRGEAIDSVWVGQQNIGVELETEITCIFRNPNDELLSVTPDIITNDSTPGEFSIKESIGTVNLEPDSCISLTVIFTPTAPGIRTATITYNLDENCEHSETKLAGEGFDSDITVEPVDWGRRRVNTVNDTTIRIVNSGSLPAIIENIEQSGTQAAFELDLPSFPLEILANDVYLLPMRFKPEMDENSYSDTLIVTVRQVETPIRRALAGIGVWPQIEVVDWDCGRPFTIKGDTSIGTLTLRNTSIYVPTKVDSLVFDNINADFGWAGGGAPRGLEIPANGGEISVNITFTPQSDNTSGIRIAHYSDSDIGDGIGPDYNLSVKGTYNIECDVTAGSSGNMEFGGQLACEIDTLATQIQNPSSSTDLIIYKDSISITGSDPDAFAVILDDDLIIQPSIIENIEVSFLPTEEREYSASIDFINSQGVQIRRELSGRGEFIHLFVEEADYSIKPGNGSVITLNANIAALSKGPIDYMKLHISFEDNMMVLDSAGIAIMNPDAVAELQSGLPASQWAWDTPVFLRPNLMEITGSGGIPTPFNGNILMIPFIISLGEVQTSEFVIGAVQAPCKPPEITRKIMLDSVCFVDGRLITISGIEYSLNSIAPNPASSAFTIDYSIGLKANTRIELINTLGENVKTIVNDLHKPGHYEVNVTGIDIPAGYYIIRIVSGPFMATRAVIFTK